MSTQAPEPMTILCFGDSDVWSQDPATGRRIGQHSRWPGVLRNELGPTFHVIEEGLRHRTTAWDDAIAGDVNGISHLGPCLASHHPIDVVILMIGFDDLKDRLNQSALSILEGVANMVDRTLSSEAWPGAGSPDVLLIAPPPIRHPQPSFIKAPEKSQQLGELYRKLAGQAKCRFVDSGELIARSDVDGLSFDMTDHLRLGTALAQVLRSSQ